MIENIDVCRGPSLVGEGGVVPVLGLAAQARAARPDVTEADQGLVPVRPGPARQLLPGLPDSPECPGQRKAAAPEYKVVES